MCISSRKPPWLDVYVEVPGAESNCEAYVQLLNELASAIETLRELPKAPA